MNEVRGVLRWSMLGVVLLVGGCGKTDEGGGGNDGVSDDESKQLADVSEAEVTDVCQDIARVYEDLVPAYERGICVLESVAVSDEASCDAAVDVCVGDLEVTPLSEDECIESLDFRGCEATVAELNDCFSEQRQHVERVAALRSCEDAWEAGASGSEWFDDTPACERLIDRCPATFAEPDDVDSDDSDDPVSPDDTFSPDDEPYVIEGNVDGQAIEIRPSGSLSHSRSASGGSWSLDLEFGGAELWLWGEAETAQGLLRMPSSAAETSSYLCLETVEITKGTETSTWKSSQLSALPLCGEAEGDPLPLDLTFSSGYPVSGTFQGEAVAWVSQGYDCYDTCRFKFKATDTAGSGRDRWILEVDTTVEWGVAKEFEHATLIQLGGAGAVACGGGGVLTYGETGDIRIEVDALGPLAQCPGTPVDGELSGVY